MKEQNGGQERERKKKNLYNWNIYKKKESEKKDR